VSDSKRWFRKLSTAERLASFALRADVVDAAQAMVSDRRTDPQIVRLASILHETETVLRMMDGRHGGDPGLLVLTDQRIFFRSRHKDGLLAFNVQLTDISSVEGSTHRVVGTVRICSIDGALVVGHILGTQGELLAHDAHEAMTGRPQQRDSLELLGELRALRDSGEITAAEFERRKSELWGSI
jgi:hypothetical protein